MRHLLTELLGSVDGKQVGCPKCPKKFRDKWNLSRHLKLHAAVQSKMTCYKTWCNASFTSLIELAKHTKQCVFICEICGLVIERSGRDEAHIKMCARRN